MTCDRCIVGCLVAAAMLAARAAAAESDARPRIELNGTWQFEIDPDDVGVREKLYDGHRDFKRQIHVPGAWNAQGIGFDTDEQLRRYEAAARQSGPAVLAGSGRESDRLCHVYPGPAWYRRSFTIPEAWRGKVIWLCFGGAHREAQVWINGREVGSHIGYVVPFRFDVTRLVEPGKEAVVTVRVDARRRREVDPLMGCLDTLDFLFVTWGGLHRGVALEATADTWLEDVQMVPRVNEESVEIRTTPSRVKTAAAHSNLRLVVEILDRDGPRVVRNEQPLADSDTPTVIRLRIPQAQLWSPSRPYLYTGRVSLLDGRTPLDVCTVRFGMRELKVEGGRFLLNGRPIFLRGYGDDCIYPNSIAPPAGKELYRRRFQMIKDYGFNYARHHSWTPPEEYLDAADEAGVMLQPEFPHAYRWEMAATPEAKARTMQLWSELIRVNRNHPSIVTWCMGNEIYDGFEQASEMYRVAKELDPTRLVIDSDGVSRQPRPTDDFWTWQFAESGSFGYRDGKYRIGPPARPVVAHEIGYFATLPSLAQIELFGQGLKPYWLNEAQIKAREKGVEDVYPQWVDRSNRLQAACLKANIEAARRSPLLGYSVWLFQDYPNCAEGVVDMFFRPKALTAAECRKFNSPTVLLIGQDRRNYRFGQKVEIPVLVSRFEQEATRGARLRWELRAGSEVLASGTQGDIEIPCGEIKPLATVSFVMPRRPQAERLQLALELDDEHGSIANDWSFWVFPEERLREGKLNIVGLPWLREQYAWAAKAVPETPAEARLLVIGRLDAKVLQFLAAGGRVLWLSPETALPAGSTVYRPSAWDPAAAGAHLGTIFDPQHPAMKRIPSEGWCDLQFHDLVQEAKAIALDETPITGEPIIRVIDMPHRLARKAYLAEAKVGPGLLLLSGLNFAGALAADDPAAKHFLDSLIRYGLSDNFRPAGAVPAEYFRQRLSASASLKPHR